MGGSCIAQIFPSRKLNALAYTNHANIHTDINIITTHKHTHTQTHTHTHTHTHTPSKEMRRAHTRTHTEQIRRDAPRAHTHTLDTQRTDPKRCTARTHAHTDTQSRNTSNEMHCARTRTHALTHGSTGQ